MANKVTIDVEARFIDNVTGKSQSASKSVDQIGTAAEKAGKKVDELGKKTAKPKLDADDKLTKKIKDMDSKVEKLGGKKANVVISAMDKASAVIKKILGGAAQISGKVWRGIIKAKDSNALATLKKVSAGADKIAGKTWTAMVKIKDLATSPLSKIKNALFSIKSLIAAITAGLAVNQFVIKPISLADAYSSAQIGFSTLLGETQGQKMMDDLDAFAKATPFSTSNVIANAQKMMAMGWDANDLIPDMEVIGNAAAATGKLDEGLESIVRALSQIKTKGRLSTEELNQLAEAGIAAKQMLAEQLGYGTGDEGIAKMTEDLEDGAIASGEAIDALLRGMQKYDGMMDSMANETVEGLKSQIADTFEINIARRWGQGLQDGAKKGFGTVLSILDSAEGSLQEFGDLVYDIGKELSNWAADKLESAIQTISRITSSKEFKDANLFGKIGMLWKGVIANPFKEWWDGTVVPWWDSTVVPWLKEKAASIGETIGSGLSNILLGILGMAGGAGDSDVVQLGSTIGGSFVHGFLEGFDGQAITDAFVTAIKNVWNAMPTWGKVLIGAYGAAKVGGLASSLIGGISSVAGVIGSATAGTGILGAGVSTATALGAGTAVTGTALGSSLLGLGSIAGGVVGAGAVGSGVYDYYKAYKAYKEGDQQANNETTARVASGTSKIAGVAGGAAIGMAVGGPVGALIGAGVGGLVGWFAGNKMAENIRTNAKAAKFETEELQEAVKDTEMTADEFNEKFQKAVVQNMQDHFGDIKLSLSEIERMADQIVWGDEAAASFEKFSSATKAAETNMQNFNSAAESTDKWMWKASLGVKFNETEQESIIQSFDDYVSSAKSYVESQQYQFHTAVSMLVDVNTEEGQSILGTANSGYAWVQDALDKLGTELSGKVELALEDGVISLDEQAEITNLQQQIADIMTAVSSAQSSAEMELIKIKFGSGNIDLESFDTFMSTMQSTIDERMAANDEAFVCSVSGLKLELDSGVIDQEEYNRQLQILAEGYKGNIESIRAEVQNVELEIIGDAYSDVLGDDAKTKLQAALSQSLSEGINPKDWTADEARKFLGVDDLSEEAASALAQMLGGVADQLESLEVDGKINAAYQLETEDDPVEEVKGAVPDTVETTMGVNISGVPEIQNSIDVLVGDFGIPESQAASIALLLTGDKQILNQIDSTTLGQEFGIPGEKAEQVLMRLKGAKSIENRLSILMQEFGLSPEQAETILWALTGEKTVGNQLTVTAGEFGVPDSVSKTISVNITAIKGTVKNAIGKIFGNDYRGGIEGGSSSMEAFARGGIAGYSDGGVVRGGAKLITVAEEGDPEMIIPLGSQRRERGLKLWAKAGEMLGVAPRYASGGITDGSTDEGIRFSQYGGESETTASSVQVEVGGIQVQINVDAGNGGNVVDAINEHGDEIAEAVAGRIADALSGLFQNTPVRGGA